MVRWQEILQRKEAENSAFTLTLSRGVAHGEEKYVQMNVFFRLVVSFHFSQKLCALVLNLRWPVDPTQVSLLTLSAASCTVNCVLQTGRTCLKNSDMAVLQLACTSEWTCGSVWPPNASLYVSSVDISKLATPFGNFLQVIDWNPQWKSLRDETAGYWTWLHLSLPTLISKINHFKP